jgi:hypothetical protein
VNRWRWLARSAVVLVVLSAYWWMPMALRPLSFFGVRRVEVRGARYLSPSVVVMAMGLRPEASVFDNLRDIERRLSAVRGVASVTVARLLPATLRVEIMEVEPVALAEGPDGLVPVGRDGRPLPYDVVESPVDAPIVPGADKLLLEALQQVQVTDLGLYGDVAAARSSGGELVLDMTRGRVRLDVPVDPEVVRSVSAVRRTLDSLRVSWRELDGRFRGWVVVRKDGMTAGRHDGTIATPTAAPRRRTAPRPRSAAQRRAALAVSCRHAVRPSGRLS